MTINTIFFHGWGYSPEFWSNFASKINGYHSFYNRGYFSNPLNPPIPNNGFPTKAITHSMGLFFLVQDYRLDDFDEIIIYGGFKKFDNIKAVKAMKRKIKTNPQQVLRDFYQLCDDNLCQNEMINRFNQYKLEQDLQLLQDFDIGNMIDNIPYKAFHGKNDKITIIPFENAVMLENAGHLCNLT